MTQPHCPTAFRPKLHQCSVLKNCWTGTFVSWQNGPSFELYNFLLPLMFITVVLLASLERITVLEVILPSASHSCHLPLPGTVKASVQSELQEHHLLPVLEFGLLTRIRLHAFMFTQHTHFLILSSASARYPPIVRNTLF